MNILQWTPNVYKPVGRATDKPMVEIRIWLRCNFCGHVREFVTHSRSLETKPQVGTHYAAFVQELRQTRSCKNCGDVSTIPDPQISRIEDEMHRLMTDEWATDQAALDAPPFVWMQQELRSVRDEARAILREEITTALRDVVTTLRLEGSGDLARVVTDAIASTATPK